MGSFVHVNEQIRLIVSRRHRDMRICSAAFLNFPLPQWPVRTCAFAAHIHGFCCTSNFQVRAMHGTVKLRRRAGSSPFSGGARRAAREPPSSPLAVRFPHDSTRTGRLFSLVLVKETRPTQYFRGAQPNSDVERRRPRPFRAGVCRRLRCPGRGGDGGDLDGFLNVSAVPRCRRIAASRPLERPRHAVGPHRPPP